MAGRGGDDAATSLQALRFDLMDALRTCSADALTPAQRQREEIARKVAEYLDEEDARQARAAASSVPNARALSPVMAESLAEHPVQIWSTFRPNTSRDAHHTLDLIARCFAVPEMAALCRSGLHAAAKFARQSREQRQPLEQRRPSRDRIKASRLATMKPANLELAKA